MDDKKHGTIKNNSHRGRENGFILPIAMIIMLLFTFYTMSSIDRLDDERNFLEARETSVKMGLQEKICVIDLLTLLKSGTIPEVSGELPYSDGRLLYNITTPENGINMVAATLYYGKHRKTFSFFFDQNTKQIVKWVD